MLTIISDVDNDGFGKGEGLKKPVATCSGEKFRFQSTTDLFVSYAYPVYFLFLCT